MERKIKIAGVATKALGIKWFMMDNLKYLGENGFDTYVICEPTDIFQEDNIGNVTYVPVSMQRGYVSPFEVIKSVRTLYKLFKREHFDIVQYTSSNASLNASIAAWLARVPVRIYCQWGLAYSGYHGLKRFFYRTMAKITCMFSTDVQPDSYANLKYAIEDGLYSDIKGSVVHKGSACGVDMSRFNISYKQLWRSEVRAEYDIQDSTFLFGFVGRLVPDKGVNELLEAFLALKTDRCKLLIVGPFYEVEKLNQDLYNVAMENPNVIFVGPVDNTAKYYAAMDFLVLPSYREGFGSVVLEAAALAVPTICTNIKGPTDFIEDRKNGLICNVKSYESLLATMIVAMELSKEDYKKMSETAYDDVKRDFDAVVFRQHFLEDRIKLLNKRSNFENISEIK